MPYKMILTLTNCKPKLAQKLIGSDSKPSFVAGLVAIFLAVVLSLLVFTIRTCLAARGFAAPTAREIPAQLVPTP